MSCQHALAKSRIFWHNFCIDMPENKPLKVIHCRDFGYDCNAMMKGRSLDEAVDAAIKHSVSMHGQNVKDLQTPEKRAEIGAKAKEFVAPAK